MEQQLPFFANAQNVFAESVNYMDGMRTLSDFASAESGTASKRTVYSFDKLRLYHYEPVVKNPKETPLLMVYALVNRYYMMDLDEQRSLIRKMLERGVDIYLIDWGYPDQADRMLDLDYYINICIRKCVSFIKQRHELKKINMLGVCQGGVFSQIYASLHADDIAKLVLMVSPVDFHTQDEILQPGAAHIDAHKVAQAFGTISGELLNMNFSMLKPFELNVLKYLDLDKMSNDEAMSAFFMRMEKWLADSPDQAGQANAEFVQKLYQNNELVKGELHIGDQAVRLQNITMPVLNVFGTKDHLVPPASSQALKKHVGSNAYTELAVETGHIGMYVSGKSLKIVPEAIANWLDTVH